MGRGSDSSLASEDKFQPNANALCSSVTGVRYRKWLGASRITHTVLKLSTVTPGISSSNPLKFCFCVRACRPVEVPLLQSISISHPSDVLDMPVDPNEPTYCLCHQVSYGEMIGCDNPDVSLLVPLQTKA